MEDNFDKKYVKIGRGRCSFIVGNMSPWKKDSMNMCGVRTLTSFADLSSLATSASKGSLCNQGIERNKFLVCSSIHDGHEAGYIWGFILKTN